MRITVTLFYHKVNSVGASQKKKKTLYFNGIHLRLLGFNRTIFLWELNS